MFGGNPRFIGTSADGIPASEPVPGRALCAGRRRVRQGSSARAFEVRVLVRGRRGASGTAVAADERDGVEASRVPRAALATGQLRVHDDERFRLGLHSQVTNPQSFVSPPGEFVAGGVRQVYQMRSQTAAQPRPQVARRRARAAREQAGRKRRHPRKLAGDPDPGTWPRP